MYENNLYVALASCHQDKCFGNERNQIRCRKIYLVVFFYSICVEHDGLMLDQIRSSCCDQ